MEIDQAKVEAAKAAFEAKIQAKEDEKKRVVKEARDLEKKKAEEAEEAKRKAEWESLTPQQQQAKLIMAKLEASKKASIEKGREQATANKKVGKRK